MGKYEVFLYRPMRENISYRRIHFTKVVNFNDPKPALMALRNCALPEQGVLSHFVIPVALCDKIVALCSTIHLSHFIINLKWMVGGQVTTTTMIILLLLLIIIEIITIDQHGDHFVL